MTQVLTFARENQFSFTCPIFNASTKIAACIQLRDLVWAGKRVDKRLGCQACMRSSKCPATLIVDRIMRSRHEVDDSYGSAEPVNGKLRVDVLEYIRPIVVLENDLNRYGVSSGERILISSANERIDQMLKTAPTGAGRSIPRSQVTFTAPTKRTASKPTPAPVTDTGINVAAASGDMSAAINEVAA